MNRTKVELKCLSVRTVARAFGPKSIGLILGGLGCDGAVGAGFIHTAEGKVLVLDPADAVVPQMCRSVMEIGMADEILSSERVIERIRRLAD